MESIPQILVDNGGVLGLISAVILAIIGMIIRAKGPALFGAGKALPDPTPRLARIDQEVGQISEDVSEIAHRVEAIEADLKQRPTRTELHQVDKGITRLEGEFQGIKQMLHSTSSTVSSIDNFLRSLAKERS